MSTTAVSRAGAEALSLHDQSIIIDAVCPLAQPGSKFIDWYREGGVTALAPSVSTDGGSATLRDIAAWQEFCRKRADLMPIRRAADIEEAKRSKRLGIYLHFQGADPIEDCLDLVDVYKELGVGVCQLTYNVKNRIGDGCEERTDCGLSRLGTKLIERLNRARVMVDCSHTGFRTSMEAIEVSSAPVVLSHSNATAVYASPRNVSNELMDAIAGSGGVIGMVGFPGMVAGIPRPTLDDFVAHIDSVVNQVGIDHVGLGLDYYTLQAGVATDEEAMQGYQEAVRSGIWGAAYPAPPHYYPAGIETPRTLPNLTVRLIERGYSKEAIRKILGENWLRVMRIVWG